MTSSQARDCAPGRVIERASLKTRCDFVPMTRRLPVHLFLLAAIVLGVSISVSLPLPTCAETAAPHSEQRVEDEAKIVWESGAVGPALDILEEGIQLHPDALALYKLRGDILA